MIGLVKALPRDWKLHAEWRDTPFYDASGGAGKKQENSRETLRKRQWAGWAKRGVTSGIGPAYSERVNREFDQRLTIMWLSSFPFLWFSIESGRLKMHLPKKRQ